MRILIALGLAAGLVIMGLAAAPAHAEGWQGDWHHGWHRDWHHHYAWHHHYWRPRAYYAPYYYGHPTYGYNYRGYYYR
jgi:hypothetical protein